MTKNEYINKNGGYWGGSVRGAPPADWRREVSDRNTKMGYWEWAWLTSGDYEIYPTAFADMGLQRNEDLEATVAELKNRLRAQKAVSARYRNKAKMWEGLWFDVVKESLIEH